MSDLPMLRLLRLVSIADQATLGKLYDKDEVVVAVLERGWRQNKPFVSRIPAGVYDVLPHVSPSKGRCFKVQDTEPRTEILWHPGNTKEDTSGCFLPGSHFGTLRGELAVLHSRISMDVLLTRYESGFLLHIEDPDHDRQED